jgi:hypothetical protein
MNPTTGSARSRISVLLRAFAASACMLAGMSSWSQTADCLAATTPITSIDMRVLVLSADGGESALPAIQNSLDYLGVPYDTVQVKDVPLTTDMLCSLDANGTALGKYQGVMLATGSLVYWDATLGYTSALSTEEWTRLWQYEAKYSVRQASLYTQPGTTLPEDYGLFQSSPYLWGSDTGSAGLTTWLTPRTGTAPAGVPTGKTVFGYLVKTAPVVFKNTWAYTALANTAVPLLVDQYNNAIVSINTTADGRQSLNVTADGNPYLMHTMQLNYGIVNWVTKGLYVGERQVLMSAQPDDVLINDDIWDPNTNTDASGKTYRITANDYKKFLAWQTALNANNPGNIVAEMPFNAYGTTAAYATEPNAYFPLTKDDLTPAIKGNNGAFNWISHTYDHENLDNATAAQTTAELKQNHQIATSGTLNLQNYNKDSLITPDVSGLNNPAALQAMYAFGVRYIVSNTSLYCGHRDQIRADSLGCPKPNLGIYNDLVVPSTGLLMIPRYPANLFYNVSTPDEWVSEYNHIYGPAGTAPYWDHDLSYAEILGVESDNWLRYMLNFDMRPVMFHQPNLRSYPSTAAYPNPTGSRSLLSDLIDATLAKYRAIYSTTPKSLRQRQIGALMAQRMALRDALASVTPLTVRIKSPVAGATTSTIVITNPTAKAVLVPITGIAWSAATSKDNYGGQNQSTVTVNAKSTLTLTGAVPW